MRRTLTPASPRGRGVGRGRAEDFSQFRVRAITTKCEIQVFAAIQPHDIPEEADLGGGPVAVGAVNLAVDMPGINKENRVRTIWRGTLTLNPSPKPGGTLTLNPSPRGRGKSCF